MRGLVLFDIDGTLLRPGDRDHHAAFVYAMQQVYGLPATLDGVPLAGMLDSQIARLALARHGLPESAIDAQLAEMIAMMGEHYAATVARRSRLERVLPGVPAVAAGLRDDHFALGVLTGNAERIARVKLEAAELDGFFPVGAYGDVARERGHLVESGLAAAERHFGVAFRPEQTVLVGDTPRDIVAARDGGTRVLAVATGRYGVEELADHAPDAVLPDLGDPPRVLAVIEELAAPRQRG
ncbi:MAG TPA: HAD family hydrolase [Thermomicrobiaceae bacterium]|nr:HAD family hydrolase [Thermomicrobiaceae bacterium]